MLRFGPGTRRRAGMTGAKTVADNQHHFCAPAQVNSTSINGNVQQVSREEIGHHQLKLTGG